jgi:hypothetical protein
MLQLQGIVIANTAQRRFLNSAMPDAPVVDDGRSPERLARRHQRGQRLRRSMARTLRQTADRLEPALT